MLNRTGTIALCALFLAACGEASEVEPQEDEVSITQVLPTIPLPPGGQPIGTERGGDAAQLLVSTPMAADSVVVFYRNMLSRPPYRLVNEATEKAATSFYVEQDGPPLWVTVERLEGGGTMVRLAGAAIRDTSATAVTPPSDS